ncbi:U2 small nuclear ribonucleoprotein A' [Polyrhizophydium stewartii]|uniref:U2 small nuclear ribonucleoprotein A n=1 Tax=Polyrhizophydium stewartii TaxID=2732419 RepID=A0ABR4MVX0_9FUNG
MQPHALGCLSAWQQRVNLARQQNQNGALDQAGNDLRRLDNLTHLPSLKTALAANNRIISLGFSLHKCVTSLHRLILANNRLGMLGDLDTRVGFEHIEEHDEALALFSDEKEAALLRSHCKAVAVSAAAEAAAATAPGDAMLEPGEGVPGADGLSAKRAPSWHQSSTPGEAKWILSAIQSDKTLYKTACLERQSGTVTETRFFLGSSHLDGVAASS